MVPYALSGPLRHARNPLWNRSSQLILSEQLVPGDASILSDPHPTFI